MEPLFDFLHSYEGDILRTYEVLFKYYRCTNYINKKQLNTTKRKLDSIANTPVVAGDPAVDNTVMRKKDFLELLEKEFNNDTLKNFCFDMDALVRMSFTDYYCDYHVMSEYIIDSQDFMAFYYRMCDKFPYHAMAIISIINNNDSMEIGRASCRERV